MSSSGNSREIQIDETGPDFLLGELPQFLHQRLFADVRLVARNGETVSAHRAVLAPASRLLRGIFESCGSGDGDGDSADVTILLPDVSVEELRDFLTLAYTGDIAVDPAKRGALQDVLKVLAVTEDIAEETEEDQDMGEADYDGEEDDEEEYDPIDLLEPQTELKVDESWPQNHQLPQPPALMLPPGLAQKLAAQHPQLTIQPSRKLLDNRTREMLEQSDWDRATGRKCERCKCPNCCLNPGGVAGMERSLHVCHYPECGKAYKKTSHLRAHLRSHIGDQPFICSWNNCGRRFTRSDELHRHYRIHTGEKNHRCPDCDKCFSRSDHLKKHMVSHVGSNVKQFN